MNSILPLNEKKELHLLDDYFGSRIDKLNRLNLNVHPLFAEKKYLQLLSFILEIDITGLSEQEARELLSLFVELKKYAGTVYVLKKVLKILSKNIDIKEWFDYQGQPYHFKVEVQSLDKPITQEFYKTLEKTIQKYKNVRSVLEKLEIKLTTKIEESFKVGTLTGEIIDLYPYVVKNIEVSRNTKMAIAIKLSETIIINLQRSLK